MDVTNVTNCYNPTNPPSAHKCFQSNRGITSWRFTPELSVCVPDELSPSLLDQQKREQILVGLERFIRKEYNGERWLSPVP